MIDAHIPVAYSFLRPWECIISKLSFCDRIIPRDGNYSGGAWKCGGRAWRMRGGG